jgi:hypothetical protein
VIPGPDLPLPDLSFVSQQVQDDEGNPRSTYYPGDQVALTVRLANAVTAQAVDVTARLQLYQGADLVYDSHTAAPVGDQTAAAFAPGASHDFIFAWPVPTENLVPGDYSYKLLLTDPAGDLPYWDYTSSGTAFTLAAQSPIHVSVSPGAINALYGQTETLTFTVTADQTATGALLTVSFSNHLKVIGNSTSKSQWVSYPVGSSLLKEDKTSLNPSLYQMYQIEDPTFGTGTQTYTLTVQPQEGISSGDWVMYRLSMKLGANTWFLREPSTGTLDQQGFAANVIPGPDLPLPDLSFVSQQVQDDEGNPRSTYYPGDQVALTVRLANAVTAQAVDVNARLQLYQGADLVYDSHTATPVGDQTAAAFAPGASHDFTFAWPVPIENLVPGDYSYKLLLTDPAGDLPYWDYTSSGAAFTLAAKSPIHVSVSPEKLPVMPGQTVTLSFTVTSDQPAQAADLTVSFSNQLQVVGSSASQGAWIDYPAGSTLPKKDGSSLASSPYQVYRMEDSNFGAGTQIYTLTFEALAGISSQDWLMYRVAVKPAADNGSIRLPVASGDVDQQGYYAIRIQGAEPFKQYLPVIAH